MSSDRKAWALVLICLLSAMVAVSAVYFIRPAWFLGLVLAIIAGLLTALTRLYIKSWRDIAIINSLSSSNAVPRGSRAAELLSLMAADSSEKRIFAVVVAELITEHFQLSKFVILFRENDRYIPRVYSGFNKKDIVSLGADKVHHLLNVKQNTAIFSDDRDLCGLAFKDNGQSTASLNAFVFSWAGNKTAILVADSFNESLRDLLQDTEFNNIFWPGLEYNLRLNMRLNEKSLETRQLVQELAQAKRDMVGINREIKGKLFDLQAFVQISHDLYSIFNEDQLFDAIEKLIRGQLDAESVIILASDENGDFNNPVSPQEQQPVAAPALDSSTELARLIQKSPRPLLLPMIGAGISRNDPALNAILGAGFQMASAIRVAGKTSHLILVGRKNKQAQFNRHDQDYLYIIGNIASLSLDNIRQYSTIEKLSYTDSMTGIYNYRYFYKRLTEEVLRAKRYNRELALVILDIDNFKLLNDNFGHQAGDTVLKQLAELVTRTIRSIDVVSRYGGEEFCIIMPDTGIGNCDVFIERLRSQIAEYRFESEMLKRGNNISVSVGGAVFPHHAVTPDRLIYCADMALLKAKSLGRNRAIMFHEEFAGWLDTVKGGVDESKKESIS